jgi:hypothetical protein
MEDNNNTVDNNNTTKINDRTQIVAVNSSNNTSVHHNSKIAANIMMINNSNKECKVNFVKKKTLGKIVNQKSHNKLLMTLG